MNKVFILSLFALALIASDTEERSVDLYLFGLSEHPGHEKTMNWCNPGMGIGVTTRSQYQNRSGVGNYGAAFGLTIMGATYYDSYREQAYVGGAGAKLMFGDPNGFRFDVTLLAGAIHGSGQSGFMPLAFAGIGYKKWMLNVTGMPHGDSPTKPEYPSTGMVAAFLQYSYPLN